MTKHNIEKSRQMKNGQRVTIDIVDGLVRVVAWGTGTLGWYKISQMREALAFYDGLVHKYVDDHIDVG